MKALRQGTRIEAWILTSQVNVLKTASNSMGFSGCKHFTHSLLLKDHLNEFTLLERSHDLYIVCPLLELVSHSTPPSEAVLLVPLLNFQWTWRLPPSFMYISSSLLCYITRLLYSYKSVYSLYLPNMVSPNL